MLSRLGIAFLTRSKHLLISWLQSLFTVILLQARTLEWVAISFSNA